MSEDSLPKRKIEIKKDTEEPNKKLKMSMGTYSSDAWYESGEDSEFEGNYEPKQLVVSNLSKGTTEHDVLKFFEGTAQASLRGGVRVCHVADGSSVEYVVDNYDDEDVLDLRSMVILDSDEDTKAALALSGNDLLGNPVNVKRVCRSRFTICFFGFKPYLSKKYIKKQIITQFKSCGKVLKIFIPKKDVGLGYIYLDYTGMNDEDLFKELMKVDLYLAGDLIGQCSARLKIDVFRAKMKIDVNGPPEIERLSDTDQRSYLKKEDLFYLTNYEKFIETAWDLPPESGQFKITYSWKVERPDIMPEPVDQTTYDCFAVALSNTYNTACKLKGLEKTLLTPEMIVAGVGKRHQLSGFGLDRMSNAIPFMREYCDDMVIYQRPRGESYEEHEDFERFIISTLRKTNVAVAIDMPPSLLTFNGKGVYHPNLYDIIRRSHENVERHVLFLSGYGVQECDDGRRRDFWELQESRGGSYGHGGYIMIARHQCIIKQLIEIKV